MKAGQYLVLQTDVHLVVIALHIVCQTLSDGEKTVTHSPRETSPKRGEVCLHFIVPSSEYKYWHNVSTFQFSPSAGENVLCSLQYDNFSEIK